MELHGSMHSDSTPSLVYGSRRTVADVTIESMRVTPSPLLPGAGGGSVWDHWFNQDVVSV